MKESTLSPERKRFLQWCLRNTVELVCILLVVGFTVLVFLQVVFRYALHSALAWSEELIMFLYLWGIFLGAATAVRHDKHFHVDLLIHGFSPRGKLAVHLLTGVIVLSVAFIMIYKGIAMVRTGMDQISPALEVRFGYIYSVLPITGALMVIYQVPKFVRQIRALTRGEV